MERMSLGMAIGRMRGLIPSAAMDIVRDHVLPAVLERLVELEDNVADLEDKVESLQQQLTLETESESAGDG